MRCGFWPLFNCYVYPWSSQSFSKERTTGVSSRNITLTSKSNCMTYTVASSVVRTSPFAVISVVGLLDVLMVSSSADLKSFCTAHMNPEDPFFRRRIECSLVFFFELVCFWQGCMPCRGHIALVFQSLLSICPQISLRRDSADEELLHVFPTVVLCFSGDFLHRVLPRLST